MVFIQTLAFKLSRRAARAGDLVAEDGAEVAHDVDGPKDDALHQRKDHKNIAILLMHFYSYISNTPHDADGPQDDPLAAPCGAGASLPPARAREGMCAPVRANRKRRWRWRW